MSGVAGYIFQAVDSAIQLTTTVLSYVSAEKQREFELKALKLQMSMRAGDRAAELELLNRQAEINLELAREQSRLQIHTMNETLNAQIKATVNREDIGVKCAEQYDATGSLPPICQKAGFNAQSIGEFKQKKAQENYKKAITGVVVLVAIIFIVAKYKNKLK